MLIGYARASKADGSQSLDLQRDALRAVGVDDDRPGLGSCVRVLRTGDVLVVWKLARLRPQPCSPSQHHAGSAPRPIPPAARLRARRVVYGN